MRWESNNMVQLEHKIDEIKCEIELDCGMNWFWNIYFVDIYS